jgi:hypothetical protein
VGHLVGGGQVGDQLARDAEPVRDDAGDVDGRVGDPLDRRDHAEHRRHGVGLAGVPGGHHAHRAHVVDERLHALLELAHLLGHVGIAEVQGGVGQVDHQLREVLAFGEHLSEVAGSVVHASLARIGQVSPSRAMAQTRVNAPTKSTDELTTGMP